MEDTGSNLALKLLEIFNSKPVKAKNSELNTFLKEYDTRIPIMIQSNLTEQITWLAFACLPIYLTSPHITSEDKGDKSEADVAPEPFTRIDCSRSFILQVEVFYNRLIKTYLFIIRSPKVCFCTRNILLRIGF